MSTRPVTQAEHFRGEFCSRLVLFSLALLSGCSESASGPRARRPEWPVQVAGAEGRTPAYDCVVLVTLDTVRADHLSSYGYPRTTTPFLDTLAADGVRFAHVQAAAPFTAPSHATLLTGLVPPLHGVQQNGQELPPGALDLAQLFRAAGFATGAFLNVGFLRDLAGSFETLETRPIVQAEKPKAQSRGDVVSAALDWAAGRTREKRLFLWVHLYDAHEWKRLMQSQHGKEGSLWSGETPPDFVARLAKSHGWPPPVPGEPYQLSMGTLGVDPTGVFGPDKVLRCVEAYDELILRVDAAVRRLYDGLEALGRNEHALWIVTSDHGEGLGSHGYPGHTGRVFQEQLQVPLLFHAGDGSLRAGVVDELVSHVDVFPTLVATLGLEVRGIGPGYEGRTLWPFLRREQAPWPPRLLFSQRTPDATQRSEGAEAVFALRDRRFKLIRFAGRDSLFDLEADPRELDPLEGSEREASPLPRALTERLRFHAEWAPEPAQAGVSAEELAELRALGYAAGEE